MGQSLISLSVASDTLHLKRLSKGPDSLAMSVSIDDQCPLCAVPDAFVISQRWITRFGTTSGCTVGLVLTVTALINLLLSDDFCCEDGLLYVVCLSVPTACHCDECFSGELSPRGRWTSSGAREGKWIVSTGCITRHHIPTQLYSRLGKFVAVTCQEGVVRADRRAPGKL